MPGMSDRVALVARPRRGVRLDRRDRAVRRSTIRTFVAQPSGKQRLFGKDRVSDPPGISEHALALRFNMYIHNRIPIEMEKIMAASGKASEPRARVWRNARLATLAPGACPGSASSSTARSRSQDGRIVYAGPEADLPAAAAAGAEIIDCDGRWITPGLIDCHTHLVHAGNRANEFEMRLAGASYEEIARAGGGIVSTVKALRAASEDELVAQSLPRLDALIAEGVTTIEIKSGYGLDLENEAKSLRAARRLGDERPVTVRTTFLGAHALPPEANGDKDAYIATVVRRDAAGDRRARAWPTRSTASARASPFRPSRSRASSTRRSALGLPVKLHADQLSNLHGAALAARYRRAVGRSSRIHRRGRRGRDGARPAPSPCCCPAPSTSSARRRSRRSTCSASTACKMAVATDCNPGTSPLTSLLLTMNMAATLFRMTVEECLAGVTREAARALGLLAETGTLEAGKWADLAIWDIERPAELVYRMGFNPLHQRIWRGR